MNSLELRTPFLDIDLVDFIRRIPASWKYRHGISKYLFKSAMKDLLPAEIINRPKQGFGVPVATWFRNWDFSLDNLPEKFSRDFIRRRIKCHQQGRRNDRLFLWNLLLVEKYLTKPADK